MSASRTAIRGFSVANGLLSLSGLYFLFLTALLFATQGAPSTEAPYLVEVYFAMTAINLLFLIALIVTVPHLWRFSQKGLLICNLLFSLEIVYFVTNTTLGLFFSMSEGTLALIGMSMGAAGGIGDMGLVIQFVTGYPIIALVGLNIAYRKLYKRS